MLMKFARTVFPKIIITGVQHNFSFFFFFGEGGVLTEYLAFLKISQKIIVKYPSA